MSLPQPIGLWTGTGDTVMDGSLAVTDITGSNSTPPLVYLGDLPRISDNRVLLALHHVVDVVAAAGPVLTDSQRAQIASHIGAISHDEAQELLEANVRLSRELADVKEKVAAPLAEVIDFAKAAARIQLEREQAQQKPVA